jgi:ankyrin repeat protein
MGNTPLDDAITKGQLDAVGNILSVFGVTRIDKTHDIILAVALNDIPKVKLYIESGYSVNVQNRYGRTPLHLAADNQNREITEILLDADASVYARDNFHRCPDIRFLGHNSRHSFFEKSVDGGENKKAPK